MAEPNPDVDLMVSSPARYLDGSLAGAYLDGSMEPEEAKDKPISSQILDSGITYCPVQNTAKDDVTCPNEAGLESES